LLVHVQNARQETAGADSHTGLGDCSIEHRNRRADNVDDPQHSDGVVLTEEDGLPATCAANFDNLQTVPKGNVGDRISHLTTRKLNEAAKAISFALGFDAD
jgi:hypothetical protein